MYAVKQKISEPDIPPTSYIDRASRVRVDSFFLLPKYQQDKTRDTKHSNENFEKPQKNRSRGVHFAGYISQSILASSLHRRLVYHQIKFHIIQSLAMILSEYRELGQVNSRSPAGNCLDRHRVSVMYPCDPEEKKIEPFQAVPSCETNILFSPR